MGLLLKERVVGYIAPLGLLSVAIYGHLLAVLDILFFQWRPRDLLSRSKVQRKAFAKFWLRLESSLAKRELESPVPELVASASGIILELGPGSGTQVLRYNPKKVTRIYGVEPNVDLHDRLRARVKEAGLSDIYTIIPCGIDDVEELKKYDIKGESFDTILIIQVLCGVASPKEAVASAYRLLKPGGEMIVYEHGLNKVDLISRIVQSMYNIIWPHVLVGCHLTRDVGRTLVGSFAWSKVDLHQPTDADAWTLLPRTYGRLYK